MPDMNAIDALKLVRRHNNEIKILMLTVLEDDQNVFQAIKNERLPA